VSYTVRPVANWVMSANVFRYAEMEKAEKNKISPRFKALEKLREWLQKEEY
jgi:inosine/xanthosine triphosphate pyrophosphatase family protein